MEYHITRTIVGLDKPEMSVVKFSSFVAEETQNYMPHLVAFYEYLNKFQEVVE